MSGGRAPAVEEEEAPPRRAPRLSFKFAIIIGWSLGVSLSYFDWFIYNVGFFLAPVFYSLVLEQFQFPENPSQFFGVCEKENISYPALLCIQMAMSIENEFVDQASF